MQPPHLSGDPDKSALRRELLTRRAALSREFVHAASAAVARRVWELPRMADAREILAYLPIKNEVDAGLVVREALARGKRLLLPRCRPEAPGALDLGPVSCLEELRPGRFGILEPDAACCRAPETFTPDIILLPGLAYDSTGTRLGFGGGYYDRLLALPMADRAFLVGLAYAFQVLPRLPRDPWDKPVNVVITEHQTHRITP